MRRVVAVVIGVVIASLASIADAQAPIAIELEVGAREARAIDPGALREAMTRELGIEVGVASGALAGVPRVRVRQIARGRATLELVRLDGTRMRRSTVLPAESEERLETIVILAVNLVRDEASELLELLRTRRERAGSEGASETETATDSETDTDTESETATDSATDTDIDIETATDSETDSETETATETAAVPSSAVTSDAAPAAIDVDTTLVEASARPPGPRFLRVALGALVGSVPRGAGYEATALYGVELAWTPTEFLAFGLRDVSGGSVLASNGRWSVGGAAFGEVGWILDPALVLHLEVGVDVRANGASEVSAGIAPMLLLGARWFPIRELSIALQTALHVVATEVWSSNVHLLPQGAILWTAGLSIAGHVS